MYSHTAPFLEDSILKLPNLALVFQWENLQCVILNLIFICNEVNYDAKVKEKKDISKKIVTFRPTFLFYFISYPVFHLFAPQAGRFPPCFQNFQFSA